MVLLSLIHIYPPGHSPDSIMLAEDDRKLLFTGDTFYPAALYVALASDRPVPELLDVYKRQIIAYPGRVLNRTQKTAPGEGSRFLLFVVYCN